MVTNLTEKNYKEEVLESKLPVVIDVFADWCGPCMMMKPVFEELSKELGSKYKFLKVNVDEERELAVKFGVSSIPTMIFIKNGEVVGKEIGYVGK
jgi:thioredoxin 1